MYSRESIYCDSDAFQFACVHLLLVQDPNCLSRRVRSSLHPAYGILKGNHLALQVAVQACSTYQTLTMPISICIGLKSFQNGQISLLWYGVVNGILPSNAILFAHAAALHWSTAWTQHGRSIRISFERVCFRLHPESSLGCLQTFSNPRTYQETKSFWMHRLHRRNRRMALFCAVLKYFQWSLANRVMWNRRESTRDTRPPLTGRDPASDSPSAGAGDTWSAAPCEQLLRDLQAPLFQSVGRCGSPVFTWFLAVFYYFLVFCSYFLYSYLSLIKFLVLVPKKHHRNTIESQRNPIEVP